MFQEFSILDVTVAENIGRPMRISTPKSFGTASKKAGLTETIQKLPNGLDTHVGREST